MFTKDNIISARYMNAENDTVEVLYRDVDETVHAFIMPARPTTSKQWKVLKEAGWTLNKVKKQTVEWIREQRRIYEHFAADLAKVYAEEGIARVQAEEARNYQQRVEQEADKYDQRVAEATAVFDQQVAAEAEKYENRISDITTTMQSGDRQTADLFALINDFNSNDEAVFKFKLSMLEDETIFEGLTKADEKKRRREIRKCKTLKELFVFLV